MEKENAEIEIMKAIFEFKEMGVVTNGDRIRAMSDEELAEYLFNRGNCSEYCYGICAYQDECDGSDHAQEFCIEQIVKWLKQEVKE